MFFDITILFQLLGIKALECKALHTGILFTVPLILTGENKTRNNLNIRRINCHTPNYGILPMNYIRNELKLYLFT